MTTLPSIAFLMSLSDWFITDNSLLNH